MRIQQILIFFIGMMCLCGCASAMRFSQDEIKDFPVAVQDQIRNAQISIGMTKVQVRYAWGGPISVTVLAPTEDGKERVEWKYKRMPLLSTRLVFCDDTLADIIN